METLTIHPAEPGNTTDASPNPGGGKGGGLESDWRLWKCTDSRQAAKSILEGWDVPTERRPMLVENLYRVLLDSTRSNRERQSAGRALIAAAKTAPSEIQRQVATLTLAVSDPKFSDDRDKAALAQPDEMIRQITAAYVQGPERAVQATTRRVPR